MFFDRDAEHAGGGFAVEVFALAEGVQGGGFSCEPGDDARFDCGEVSDDESVAEAGDEGGPDELAECVGHGFVEQLHRVQVACSDERSCLVEVRWIVSWEVLDLDEASGEAPGASCSVELDESACPAIGSCDVLHRLVFLHARFRQITTESEDFFHLTGCGVKGGIDVSFR